MTKKEVRSEESGVRAEETKESQDAEKAKRMVAVARFTADQQVIENLADELTGAGISPITGMEREIAAIVMRAESYQDMLTELYASFKGQDPDTFVELMRQAVFAADLWGDYTARRRS